MTANPLKAGVLVWNQCTDWPELREVGATVDGAGYDTLWTWDHLYPIQGSIEGPFLEGYMILAGWSQVTTRSELGLMVGANTFRNPALVVKMVTALDHLSSGRAILGIGGAWFETEHTAFGIDFGSGFGERLDRLDEAAELMRAMLREPAASARGRFYHARGVRNDPPPVRERLPVLIGGAGEQKTLRTVARYADMWNVALVTPDEAAHKDGVLRRWCEEVGRDPQEIERTLSLGPVVIRDDPAEAQAVVASFKARNRGMTREVVTGTAAELAAHARPYVERGFRHLIIHAPAPYDLESVDRFANEVMPQLRR
jgi:alkanesulfonate monooxygenase SsuD/methylene tetrahydromethanopterin reductase-like flavin-dependent oxidoreductase (luciferase family)